MFGVGLLFRIILKVKTWNLSSQQDPKDSVFTKVVCILNEHHILTQKIAFSPFITCGKPHQVNFLMTVPIILCEIKLFKDKEDECLLIRMCEILQKQSQRADTLKRHNFIRNTRRCSVYIKTFIGTDQCHL